MKKLFILLIVLCLIFAATTVAFGGIQSSSDFVTYSSSEPGWFLVTPVAPSIKINYYGDGSGDAPLNFGGLGFQYFENYQSFLDYHLDWDYLDWGGSLHYIQGSFKDKLGFFLGTDFNLDPGYGDITRHHIYPGYCLSFNKWGYLSASIDYNLTPSEAGTYSTPAVDGFAGFKADGKIFFPNLCLKGQIELDRIVARNFNFRQEEGVNFKPFNKIDLFLGAGFERINFFEGYYYGATYKNRYFTMDGAYGKKLIDISTSNEMTYLAMNYYEADAMLTLSPFFRLGGRYFKNKDSGNTQILGKAGLQIGKFKTTLDFSPFDTDPFVKLGCQIDL